MLLEVVIVVLVCCYLYSRLTCGKTESATCLVGKTALVTGGNDGIGFQVCLNLASRGCRVIIADKDDSRESKQKIIEQTNNPNIISKKFNLASFQSVRSLAKEINETEERLDILINNAGTGSLPEAKTEDGLNALLQVNYFGGFLLTHLLIGLLKKSAPSRIVFTSSSMAYLAHLRPEDLLRPKFGKDAFTKTISYSNTKLMAILMADIFSKKLKGSGVTANAISPGWTRTGIWNKSRGAGDWTSWIGIQLMSFWCYVTGKSVWEGAQTTTHVAVAADLENVSGEWFEDCRPITKPPQVRGDMFWPLSALGYKYKEEKEGFGEKAWRISEECCKLQPDERI